MSRLTYKKGKGLLVDNNIDYGTLTNVCYQNCVDKLGKLEDIEDELGIDLVTLIKALKKGVFYKDYKEPIRHTNNLRLSCLTHDEHWSLDNKWHWFSLKEYGKTWALTKEELEK